MPNEMVKELAEQANWCIPEGLPSDWDQGDYVVSPEQMQKFAELIIRECISMCDTVSADYLKHRKGAFDFQDKNFFLQYRKLYNLFLKVTQKDNSHLGRLFQL